MNTAVRQGAAAAAQNAAFAFSDQDFAVIARLAHEDFGLHLTEVKKDLVYSRLTKRLRQLGLADFASYCRRLQGEDAGPERMQMLTALTTNVTHFFREEHHFTTLRDTVLPPLIRAARAGRRVRLWSAGCSAGQEPYSMALSLLEICPDAASLDIRILATDVDPVIVARAKAGTYDHDEVKSLPGQIREKHLTEAGAGRFAIGPRPRELIRFAELNLMADWPFSGPFDAIFCRNVAIYFDKHTQARLWQRYAGLLAPGGYLFIGHSERLSGPAAARFRPAGVTAYCKSGAEPGEDHRALEGGTKHGT